MRALTFDGEMNYETVRKLEKSIEQQTGVHPIAIFENRRTVTATDLVQLTSRGGSSTEDFPAGSH